MSSPSAKVVEYDEYIDKRIGQTRRTVRAVDLAAALAALVVGVVGFFLTVALVEHWLLPGGFGTLGRFLLFAVLVGGSAYYAYRRVWPLCVRSINPVYAAHTIEQGSPSLKNSLVNLLLFRQQRTEIADAVYETLEEQAAQRLTRVPPDTAVDRTQLIRLGYILVAVVAAAALYKALSPKDPIITAERVLMPWADVVPASRVIILSVEPGTTTVARGELVNVTADVRGLRDDDPVLLRYTTADRQAVDKTITMSPTADGLRFERHLPSASEPGGDVGVTQNLHYRVEAGDARSHEFTITVVAAPAILVQRVDYDYPDYTDYADRHVDDVGDVSAIEGTRVTVHARANGPIDEAYVDFDADGRRDVKMTADGSEAQASFTLALRSDRRTPQHTSYTLRFTNTEGRANRDPVKHPIDVLPDYAPEVELLEPVEKTRDVQLDETVTIAVEARDPDFALSSVRLQGEVSGRPVLDEPLLEREHAGRFVGRYQFTPGKHDLKAGDVVQYWASAADNRAPEPNTATSERRVLRITTPNPAGQVPPDQIAQQEPGAGQQDQRQQDGQDQGAQGEQQAPAADQGQEPNEGQQGGNQGGGGQSQPGNSQGDSQPQNQPGASQGAGGAKESAEEAGRGDQPSGELAAKPGQRDNEPGNKQKQTGAGASGGKPSGTSPDGTRPDQSIEPRPGDGDEQGAREAEPSPISPDGDNDAEAFDRIRRHMRDRGELSDEPDRPQSQQQPAGAPQARRDAQRRPADQEQSLDGNSQPSNNQQPAGSDAEKQVETPDGAQRSTDKPGESPTDAPPPSGQPTGSEGPSGAGEKPDTSQGMPASAPETKPTGKPQQEPSARGAPRTEEPPMEGRGQRQSDSQGEQGGDRKGDGEEGTGQQAPREGTGSAGQNQSADEGSGESAEQGIGSTSPNTGRDVPGAEKTGQQGTESTGQGTAQRKGQGEKPGGKPGETATDGEPQPGVTDNQRQSSEGSQPSESTSPPQEPSDQPGDAAGTPSDGGGRTGTTGTPPPASGTAPEADDANLEYVRKQTDLVLERLADQLKRQEVDQQLLDQLGWSEEDLRKFVERWQERIEAAEADTPTADPARRELDEALRSLGLRRDPLQQDALPQDDMRDLSEGYRDTVPLEYQERLRAYSEGVSRARPADE